MDEATPTFVWGTNIGVQDVKNAIQIFIKHFRETHELSNDIHGEGKYTRLIHKVLEIEGEWIDVDAHDVLEYDSDLYNKMVRYPLEVLAIFDIILMDIVSLINPLFDKHVQFRIHNLKSSTSMRNLNPSDIEQMVSLKGMVIRCSSIIPEIREAVFSKDCLAKNSMTLVHNRCRFADKQIVRLQETPDEIPKGGTPHIVSLLMHDKLVDAGKPGDRVEVSGIYRAMSVRVGPSQRTVKSLFKTYIDCLHIKKTDKSRMMTEDSVDIDKGSQRVEDDVQFDEGKVEELKELLKQPDIYERLTRSLAPNICELGDVKKGLLCQLLQYIHKLSPRGIYTSGRGSSAVGLTAYVAKDPETGETVLVSGALVLSDRGICCIDEFDKMSDNACSRLHEVMEEQTVSIAKAGIIASLNARTSVLACANPSGSRYNPRLFVIDNIHLPPTLLSRFDLIYLILDKADEQTDRRLAKHIVSLHFEDAEIAEQDVLDLATLTVYVSYARKNIHPKLSDEAFEELTRGYVEMRKKGNFPGSSKKSSQQHQGKLRVEMRDVTEAFRLLEVAMQQSATDHSTGTIGMDLITTGVSASERMRRENVLSATRNIIMEKSQVSANPSPLIQQSLDELKKQSSGSEIHEHELRNAVATLASEDLLFFMVTA
ncbi:hypothetical protein PTKIN_Ptkin02bG0199300 [Pterospermum kingtungense]